MGNTKSTLCAHVVLVEVVHNGTPKEVIKLEWLMIFLSVGQSVRVFEFSGARKKTKQNYYLLTHVPYASEVSSSLAKENWSLHL